MKSPAGGAHPAGLFLRFLRNDAGGLDVVEAGEVRLQVGVALGLDGALVGGLAVLEVEGAEDRRAVDDLAERREALPVEAGVVAEVEEDLRRAAVGRPGLRERDVAGLVRLAGERVVLDGGRAPLRVDRRVAVDADL